jgi:low affinity Fe/Cu permease
MERSIVNAKSHWTTKIGQATGHPAGFAVVIVYAVLWVVFDPSRFDWNAVATLAVWIMTLLIQRANRRDTLALHAKLDELLRVNQDARSELTRMDEQEPEEIARHRDDEVQKGDIVLYPKGGHSINAHYANETKAEPKAPTSDLPMLLPCEMGSIFAMRRSSSLRSAESPW